MIWEDALTIFYSAVFGGFLGAFIAYAAIRNEKYRTIKILEEYWDDDIRNINLRLGRLESNCIKNKQ